MPVLVTVTSPVGFNGASQIGKGSIEMGPQFLRFMCGGVNRRVENPLNHLILPGMRSFLSVVMNDDRIFASLCARFRLLPAPQARAQNEGYDCASKSRRIR